MDIIGTTRKYAFYLAAWLTALLPALILSGCDSALPEVYQGYAEGDFVYISPETAGRLVALEVKKGEQVEAGQALARLDSDSQHKQVAVEESHLQAELATLADLRKGQRRPELNSADARIAQARQDAKIAASKLERYKKIRARDYLSEFELQQAQAESRQKQARVSELISQRESSALPSRQDQILAQQARVDAAREALEQRQIDLNKRTLVAAAPAVVYDVISHPGEVITPGQPVLSLLPQDALKIRFFVPARRLNSVAVGQKVSLLPDGLSAPLAAEVNFISPKAEYAPPVIYSRQQRERLMFMVEAVPLVPSPALKPGLPVEVKP